MRIIKKIEIPDRWLLHSYYTLCPYAPDGSGRILAAGVDIESETGKVFILGTDGEILDQFGEHQAESSFYHTGFWQTWSPDCRYVYFQSGSLAVPTITRRELGTGTEITLSGDAEGAPPDGEPVISGLMGMLYAAGYGYGTYNPAIAPVPFEKRDEHGIFEYDFDAGSQFLRLSVNDILDCHPEKADLLEIDRELSRKNGTAAGLTLMAYCVRWNHDARRLVFYFGNHCVVKERCEPKVACLFTCNRDFTDLHFALDLSKKGGGHWSWHPDGEHLIGYGNPLDNDSETCCMSIVRYNGTGFRKLCSNYGLGHPSVSPTNYDLLVTDSYSGDVIFHDISRDECIETQFFPNRVENSELSGRNRFWVCHHPVFTRDGTAVLFNVLDDIHSSLYKIAVPEEYR